MSNATHVRNKILQKGVANLKEFGYPQVTIDNILTDSVFKPFFRSMLEDARGQGSAIQQQVIKELLAEVSK